MTDAVQTRPPASTPHAWGFLDAELVELLDTVRQYLQIDDEFTQWHEDGFTWWLAGHAQRFRAYRTTAADGRSVPWLSFRSGLLRDVPHGARVVDSVISSFNGGGEIANCALDGDRLVLRGKIAVGYLSAVESARLLADRAVIADNIINAKALPLAQGLRRAGVELSGVVRDVSTHPTAGERTVPHPLGTATNRLYAVEGSTPLPPERKPDLKALFLELIGSRYKTYVNGPHNKLIVTDFKEGLPNQITIDLMERNKIVGNGLFVRHSFRIPPELAGIVDAELSHSLNRLEWESPEPQILGGGWVTHAAGLESDGNPLNPVPDPAWTQEPSVTLGAYYPNRSVTAELARAVALDSLARAERVGNWLLGRGSN